MVHSTRRYLLEFLYIMYIILHTGPGLCGLKKNAKLLWYATIFISFMYYFFYTRKVVGENWNEKGRIINLQGVNTSVHGHWHSVSTHTVLTLCQYGPHSKLIFQEHYHSQRHSEIIHFWRIFCEFLKKSKFHESFITRNWFFGGSGGVSVLRNT